MKPHDLAGIHDILPLEHPPLLSSTLLLALVISLAAALAILLIWHRYRPLNRLRREVRKGRRSTRDAAHRLAQLAPLTDDAKKAIDKLRFSRQPPDPDALLVLIDKIQHGR